ncbi:MAG TPA: molybdopterin cofactor-binding domain-containing protein, partial [Acidimicrobiales bacterium]|nr:molybdopterin cofactor-binding domain-containing protein [Acidimicrobiales bacterium]
TGMHVARVADLLDEPISRTVVYHHRRTEPIDDEGQGDPHVCFAFGAERAVVDVDEELGLVRVVQVTAAIDVGHLLNPSGFEGQVAGATAQGIGLAVMEELHVRDGVIANPSFTDYVLPTVLDTPPIVAAAVERPEPGTPYGLKGIGETPTVVATAAVVAALRDATGRELNRAPVAPDDLVGLRGPVQGGDPPPVPPVPGQAAVPLYHGTASGQQHLMAPTS